MEPVLPGELRGDAEGTVDVPAAARELHEDGECEVARRHTLGFHAWQYSTPWSTHPWRCSFSSAGASFPTCAKDLPATTSLMHATVTCLRFGSHFFSFPF